MAMMPTRHLLVEAMAIMMVMVIVSVVGLNHHRSGVGRNGCRCKRSKGECRSDKKLVHCISPVTWLSTTSLDDVGSKLTLGN